MNLREQLLTVSDAYAQAIGIGRKRVSTIVLNGGGKLDRIAAGGDLVTGSFERSMAWFSENWPDGVAWPDGIARPRVEAAE